MNEKYNIISNEFEDDSIEKKIALEFEGFDFIRIDTLASKEVIKSIRNHIKNMSKKIILTIDEEENKKIITGCAIRSLRHAVNYIQSGSGKKEAEIIPIREAQTA